MSEKTVSNIIMRILIDSTEDILGKNGLAALLKYCGLSDFIDNRPDFSLVKNYTDDDLNRITSNFYDFIGPGAKAIFRMVGKSTVKRVIDSGALAPVMNLKGEEKFIGAMQMYALATGKGEMKRVGNVMVYDNPACAGRAHVKSEVPVCSIINGIMDRLLAWSEVEGMRSIETKCKAMGDDRCCYEVVAADT